MMEVSASRGAGIVVKTRWFLVVSAYSPVPTGSSKEAKASHISSIA